jgi:hypothetical protein
LEDIITDCFQENLKVLDLRFSFVLLIKLGEIAFDAIKIPSDIKARNDIMEIVLGDAQRGI